MKRIIAILSLILLSSCMHSQKQPEQEAHIQTEIIEEISITIPPLNQAVLDTVLRYGPEISPTYEKAVCTEMIIPIIEKFHKLSKTDRQRLRIITNGDIQQMLKENSPVPKGVYYALMEKGVGTPIDTLQQVLPGDFVQFWTTTWGHCGIVKSINPEKKTMELYSSFPTTDGYGVLTFPVTKHSFFVRLK